MNKKKLLLFIKCPPPLTGATQINLFVKNNSYLLDNFIMRSIDISYSKSLKHMGHFSLSKIYTVIKNIVLLLIELIRFRPQLVYFQLSPLGMAFLRDLIYIIVIKLSFTRILYHLHGKGIKKRISKNIIYRFIYQFTFKNEFIICLSKKLTDDVNLIYSGSPFVVNNGIPSINYKLDIQTTNNKKTKILFLSNLIRSKGILDFLDILKNLNDNNIEYDAIICGHEAGLTKESLNYEIHQRNLGKRVQYIGPVMGIKKAQVLASSDIFLYPTHNDVFPLVLLEAMQYGIPVISTFEGAIPEIIKDGVNGVLIEKKNVKDFAAQTKMLLKNDKLRQRLGASGKERFFQKYTQDCFDRRISYVFNEIIKKHNVLRR